MTSLVELYRDNAIDPDRLARLLGELPPAPLEAQARASHRLARQGAHMERPLARALARIGRSDIGGGALGTGTGATYRTTPEDAFVIPPEEATIRNTWVSPTKAFPGFGQRERFDVANRGILAELELLFAGTYTRTDGTGTHTVTDYSPYGLLDNIEFAVNGSALKSAQGLAYDFRRQVVTRKAADSMTSTPSAAGANTWDLRWRVPVADNLRNLWGAILAQADDLYLSLDLVAAAQSKIVTLTGNATVTLTGTYQLVYIAYDAPIVNIEGVGERVVLPDTDVLHRFHEFSKPVVSTGETELVLQRTAGEVERIFLFLDNASSTLMDPSSWSEIRFKYAATEQPIAIPAKSLLAENARNYTARITPKCAVLDFSAYNQRRDALFPRAVADPTVVIVIPSSVTVNAGARLYAVQESLVGGA